MAKLYRAEQFQLSNGIPVVLQHSEGPAAATYWWVKTGSADESPSEAGYAHFLEHMLFKDAAAKETGRASTGQMARVIESLGGDINAYTSFDQTVYHVTCAAQHWEKILDAFGTMAKPQRFLAKDFAREREVILEELRKNEDSPGRQLFQSLFESTFSKHPYGRPVIGYVKTLKAANVQKLEAFYKRNYISGKMGLVLVGPIIDAKGTRKKNLIRYLEKHYGSKVIRRVEVSSAKGTTKRQVEPQLRKAAQWSVKPFDVKTPTLSLSFRVPELAHEDLPALDLLSGILGVGELSRLYQKLFYGSSLVTDISSGLYVPKDPGMVYFQAEVDSISKIKQTVEDLLTELRRIGEEGVRSEEIARVLVGAESERLYATQTADGLAGRLGFLKFIMGNLDFDQQYLDDLRSVDSNRIKEVARKYLDYRRMSAVVLVPKEHEKFDTQEIEAISERILAPQSEEGKILEFSSRQPVIGKSQAGGVEFIKLPSGLQVCYYYRPQSHVFSIHASVLGGLRLEVADPIDRAETDWGSSNLMSMVWSKGTSTCNANQIMSMIEGKAASIEGFSGRNSVGVQATGLARDWGFLSHLFSEILLDPTFPEEEVGHARRVIEESIRGIEDHSSQLCSKLFLETLFETHPYGRLTTGSIESVKEIHSEKLKAFHRNWIKPERMVISISGEVKPVALESWALALEKQVKVLSTRSSRMIPERLESEPDLKAPRWVERNLAREQCHLLVGGLGTQIDSEDRYALRLLQTLLGGQSGRLFIELREKKSLAYTVSPISFEGLERGYLGTYIACAPQKKEEALSGIREVLEKLVQKGPSVQEMKRAKEYFMGRRAMDLQGDSSLAAHFGLETLYRLPCFSEEQLLKKINSISEKQLQQVCQKYWVDPFMVTSSVG